MKYAQGATETPSLTARSSSGEAAGSRSGAQQECIDQIENPAWKSWPMSDGVLVSRFEVS